MLDATQIEKMSVAKRLKMMEQLWDSLSNHSDEIASPDWHHELLVERKARAQRGDAGFLTLDQLRTRLRSSKAGPHSTENS